ncbi:MAG: site-2 protease family protein [Chloroflexi bacterium]|nr:site-2 protease family protein [Chloroflexota bacterium]
MQQTIRLGRIAGIEIGVHYTWLFAFALVTWSLAAGLFPADHPGWSPALYWVTGAVGALALFSSVLLHELSHSFVALARGIGVHSITLFIFGGVSNIKGEAQRAGDEFLVAVVGPLSSFVLAGVFWVIQHTLPLGTGPLGALVDYLAFINLMLGVFNLLPGFPLDGGRVLRSIIWGSTRSFRRATTIASYVGQSFGFLFIAGGLFLGLSGQLLSGLWTAFIGWFINNAAESVRNEQVTRESLQGVRVAEVMSATPPVTNALRSVHDFVMEDVMRHGVRAMLVVDGGQLVGIVSITDARQVPQAEWSSTALGQIMTPAPLKTVSPQTSLEEALRVMVEHELNQLPVVIDGRLVGLVGRVDILRYLQLAAELRLPPRNGAPRSEG